MKDNITVLPVRPRTDDEFMAAAHVMVQEGGGFAGHIAKAYYLADSHNRLRLRSAFPDLFTRYFGVSVARHVHGEKP